MKGVEPYANSAPRAREGLSVEPLDWASVASLLAESDPRPLLVLDSMARIRLSNPAMDGLLGRAWGELLGRTWTEIFLLHATSLEEPLLEHVQRGAVRKLQSEASSTQGHRLYLTLELSHVGRGNSAGVLVTVTSFSRLDSPCAPASSHAHHYEVCSRLQDFGIIRAAHADGLRRPELEGKRCFEALRRRTTPCPMCPVLAEKHEGWPRTAVFPCTDPQHPFQILTARPVDVDHVHLTLQSISGDVFRQLVQAKVESLAMLAGLSERERRVLDQLVGGHELQEIGDVLGISLRTVKFHKANILRKLEVNSRSALMRLIL